MYVNVMRRTIIAIIIGAIAVPAAVYALSPLFIETTINESLPSGLVQKTEVQLSQMMTYSGNFVGVGDNIHDAYGSVSVIPMNDANLLRLENFHSTNGPDLHVYLSTDKHATDFIDLGNLKANNGNQNYEIPHGTDLSKYYTVLIWCKQFSVLFGSAELV